MSKYCYFTPCYHITPQVAKRTSVGYAYTLWSPEEETDNARG
jgi:hypothetical protein